MARSSLAWANARPHRTASRRMPLKEARRPASALRASWRMQVFGSGRMTTATIAVELPPRSMAGLYLAMAEAA